CLGILGPEESAEYARRAHEEGYPVLKTKAGRDWREDVERLAAMHEATDGQMDLRVDPNQGWTLDEAVRVGAALEDRGVYLQYMEQPIRVDAHDSLARLRERLRQPIAPNEDTYRPHNLRRVVERGAADAVVVDMVPAGGITGLRQIAGIAEDAGVSLVHHSAGLGVKHAAMLHAVSGLPGFSL
ncbi:MAG: mandelate racemase/muconate lactonizing enzyme family protein, partial [Halobacteriaceae archaeon]